MPDAKFTDSSQRAFLKSLLGTVVLGKDVLSPSFQPGAAHTKLVVVTGENATGKSLFRRLVTQAAHELKIEPIPISMQLRSGPSMGSMARMFVYRDESYSATSESSVHSILGAIKTSQGREQRHVIIWDEPDVGLSDNYAAGAGIEIARFVAKAPEKLFLCVVMSHRRVLLERLVRLKPHHVRFGDSLTLQEALAAPVKPKRLSSLQKKGRLLFGKVQQALNDKKTPPRG